MILKHSFCIACLPVVIAIMVSSCKKDHSPKDDFDTSGTYVQKDQMGRPAVSTVFVGAARKDEFNMTVPTAMSGLFKNDFVNKLSAFGYTANALGQTKDQFASLLVNDVLNVKMNGTTTFFDGMNVLTGRKPDDDVIDTELLLIFGGPTGAANPGLTKDNVNSNDKPFLASFPYLASPW
jgi:hypothetical protein